jgi:transcriptional regulator with XRE-family HTH domain
MPQRSNVLSRRARPTKKSYRAAVKKIIHDLQATYSLNDHDLAERLGCSGPTIANARNERTNLDGVTLANIEYEFGPSALDPFLELGGSRAVPLPVVDAVAGSPELALLDALRAVFATSEPDSGERIHTLRVARLELDKLIALGEGGSALRVVA